MNGRCAILLAGILCGCSEPRDEQAATPAAAPAEADSGRKVPSAAKWKSDTSMSSPEQDSVEQESRERMVRLHLQARDITDGDVIRAMRRVPRHELIPAALRDQAYADRPLPIGHGQTISQPYIVALMTQLARVRPGCRALDVGTGSGYQAAVLAEMGAKVYSIEILPELAEQAKRQLQRIGYDQVELRCGDGYQGWSEHAPFDVILVAAAPREIPEPLIEQLAPGGHLVIPIGSYHQSLIVVSKQPDGSLRRRTVASVAFVPMTGEAERRQTPDE